MTGMKPWFKSVAELHGHTPSLLAEVQEEAWVMGRAILDAEEALPHVHSMALIALPGHAGRVQFVAMPIPHTHGQDCGRA